MKYKGTVEKNYSEKRYSGVEVNLNQELKVCKRLSLYFVKKNKNKFHVSRCRHERNACLYTCVCVCVFGVM